jgi:hypothetical protein
MKTICRLFSNILARSGNSFQDHSEELIPDVQLAFKLLTEGSVSNIIKSMAKSTSVDDKSTLLEFLWHLVSSDNLASCSFLYQNDIVTYLN